MATLDARPPSEHAFDAVAALYDGWFDTTLGRIVDALEKDLLYALSAPRAGERVLDVGTGTGHFALDLAQQVATVVGFDLSAPMLAVARSEGGTVSWLRGDAAALPLASATFDLVLSVTALEFVASAEQTIHAMWRVVRPGGRLVVGVLNALSPWACARRRESRQQETPFSHARFFHPWELQRLLGHLGPVTWSSAVFIGPGGGGLRRAWVLERAGRGFLRPFGALLVARVRKCT